MRPQITFTLSGSEVGAVKAILAAAISDPDSDDAFSGRTMQAASRAYLKLQCRMAHRDDTTIGSRTCTMMS